MLPKIREYAFFMVCFNLNCQKKNCHRNWNCFRLKKSRNWTNRSQMNSIRKNQNRKSRNLMNRSPYCLNWSRNLMNRSLYCLNRSQTNRSLYSLSRMNSSQSCLYRTMVLRRCCPSCLIPYRMKTIRNRHRRQWPCLFLPPYQMEHRRYKNLSWNR